MVSVSTPRNTNEMNPMVLPSYREDRDGDAELATAFCAIKLCPADEAASVCAFL
jgi:hypothetical protein